MNEILLVNLDTQTVSARELHKQVGSTERFSAWFERQLQFGFVENEDYTTVKVLTEVQNNGGIQKRELTDHNLSVDMAKQICMVQKNEKAREIRLYLIDLEKKWNSPEQVMARALKLADKTISSLQTKIAEQKPLVDFAVHVSQSKDTVDMDEMAKIARNENINIGRNRLIKWLKDRKILKDNRTPYQKYIERGYFDVIEVPKETVYGPRIFPKTVITGKGQIWIVEKLRAEYGV